MGNSLRIAFYPLVLIGAASGLSAAQGPTRLSESCADPARAARSIIISRSENPSDIVVADLSSGLRISHGYKIESNAGCALHSLQFNVLMGELAIRPDVRVRWLDADTGGSLPLVAEPGQITPSPVHESSPEIISAPSIAGYRFAKATPVSGFAGAYVGIWHRTDGGSGAPSVAAAFGRLSSGQYNEPRILIRSARPLNDVFMGPSMHSDGRVLAIAQDLPGSAIRLVMLNWFSARYFASLYPSAQP